MTVQIGIADDHAPFLQSISLLINSFSHMQVILQARNGEELLEKLSRTATKPQICLIDVNMPLLDGPGTVAQLGRDYPDIRTIALSMEDDDVALIRMLKAGCRSWWLKYFAPDELEKAIEEVLRSGFYNADPLNVYHRRQPAYTNDDELYLTDPERLLLQLSCSDLSGDGIDERLDLPDQQRRALYNSLYEKLHVRSRPGAAMEGIRRSW
jgi:DNA-binding NarL/FixJ family response regulator